MPQIFSQHATMVFRGLLMGASLVTVAAVAAAMIYVRSGAYWHVGKPVPQPIPFRHDLHAGGLGLDCRYCHTSVERSASAGMPTAHTCLTCHSQVWTHADVLTPLRTSIALGQPIVWRSVHRLAPYSYFHHGAHTAASVGCTDCHGKVEEMSRTVKVETMSMGWCLECHRQSRADPATRAPRVVADAAHEGGLDERDPRLAARNRLTDCSTCHR